MRRLRQRVEVKTDPPNIPRTLLWQTREHKVQRLIDDWSYAGRWWLDEPERLYYLLELERSWVVEVYKEGERWILAAMQD